MKKKIGQFFSNSNDKHEDTATQIIATMLCLKGSLAIPGSRGERSIILNASSIVIAKETLITNLTTAFNSIVDSEKYFQLSFSKGRKTLMNSIGEVLLIASEPYETKCFDIYGTSTRTQVHGTRCNIRKGLALQCHWVSGFFPLQVSRVIGVVFPMALFETATLERHILSAVSMFPEVLTNKGHELLLFGSSTHNKKLAEIVSKSAMNDFGLNAPQVILDIIAGYLEMSLTPETGSTVSL